MVSSSKLAEVPQSNALISEAPTMSSVPPVPVEITPVSFFASGPVAPRTTASKAVARRTIAPKGVVPRAIAPKPVAPETNACATNTVAVLANNQVIMVPGIQKKTRSTRHQPQDSVPEPLTIAPLFSVPSVALHSSEGNIVIAARNLYREIK